ncbi:hypothetical protein GCM10023085_42330 [Actinomadura viridis]|uniref:Acetylornithine deacetylase/succinyl-diaminopimelate desuccinylase-like protein n=1 Tax=Actinomadura viridis TaxID=58110 RepID=A0A931DRI6_9ACTN|nr:hypothetical protein [Actinomadura viridis]MBG6092491.1 acetylornithine deacetylase/succinyl-diaminopimelate desuccinylase-like protein [Actinomadura viridis]
MASRRRRLGPFLIRTIVQVLRVLDEVPAPYGHEAAAAEHLASWCSARWPRIAWTVRRYSATGASLHAAVPGTPDSAPLIYSHLDTSLSGDAAEDRPITGRGDAPGPLTVTGDRAEGFGLGVARAPAAAALAGFVTAALTEGSPPVQLLLAGSGTHRSVLTGASPAARTTGVEHFLADGPRPSAAIVAKGGPPTLLWEEPGALYLRVRVTGGYGAVLARESATPPGGVIAHAAPLIEAMDRWCRRYAASSTPAASQPSQVGPAAGIGSLVAGRPDKPDLFAGLLEAGIYVVTVPGAVPSVLAASLKNDLSAALAGGPLSTCAVEVDHDEIHPAAATPSGAPIVRAARAAWRGAFGVDPPPITGWTGSTDGVVLRAHGVDTVRLGPRTSPSHADPRRDVAQLPDLATYAHLYARLTLTCGESLP